MTGHVFVDTNVLVYERDVRDPAKQQRAHGWLAHLWRTRGGRLSFQVLSEFYWTVTRKLRPGMEPGLARRYVRTLAAWRPIPTEARVIEAAWAFQDRYALSFWDGLIVGSARASGCSYLLSEDFQDGQDLAGLKVVNPFRVEPERLA
jgi:predicted nucleic acid-binding protein